MTVQAIPLPLAELPGRTLDLRELRALVQRLAETPSTWEHLVRHDTGSRHFASLHRDADVDVWLLC